MTGLSLPAEWRDEIVSHFERRLHALGSPILGRPDSRTQLLEQARSILDEVAEWHEDRGADTDLGAISLSIDIGASRALEGVHPAESLRVAAVLFDIALPFVMRAFSASGTPDAASRAALVLHQVIMSRLASGAVSYSGFLLRRVNDAHRAERARLARDLHDRSAHAVGVAIQNLELHAMHEGRDEARARTKLHAAGEAMREAMDSIRRFCIELRTTPRPDELEGALAKYLAANAESTVVTSVRVAGDTTLLPLDVCEEVYIVLREAIRNALVHSGATRLDVTVGISESQVFARVSDTGRGFSVDDVARAGESIGLSSMRERVQLLGGVLRLSSRPGEGTTAEISIPLGRVLL